MTRWAADVSPTNALPEYPRPQMTRPDWLNLNGLWQFQPAASGETPPVGVTLSKEILVPYPMESALSGIKQHYDRSWYRRTFDIPSAWAGQRVLLHFGAVDWLSTVTVNGRQVGSHRGGYDPFTYDITSALKPAGPQEVIVYVYDTTPVGEQVTGKQDPNPNGIWYTSSTGIWQTVWLEPVPKARIDTFHATPDIDTGRLRLNVSALNLDRTYTVQARATSADGATVVGEVTGAPGVDLMLPVPNPTLWTPDNPYLYNLTIGLYKGADKIDEIGSYFGMRKVEIGKDPGGITRPLLNGAFVFQVGPLDQGFWPDGLYTAPTDAALQYDLDMEKSLGFNMVRKHIKVEPERWYYWCDKKGLLVWQDMPSMRNAPPVASHDSRTQFEREMKRMVQGKWNHPSIVTWVVFNEGWGQYDTTRLAPWVKALDPSRLVNNATGWTDAGVGDFVDWHVYPGPGSPNPEPKRAASLGEFGGLGLKVTDHLWNTNSWSYAGYNTSEELMQAYTELLRNAYALKDNPGLSAAVYTQTTDVETEINGLMTYDRAVTKMDVARIAKINKGIFPPPPVFVSPTSEAAGVTWKYTITQPATTWMNPTFGDSAWATGQGGFGSNGTPGGIIRTQWTATPGDIWLRRGFNITSVPAGTPVLRMHHDEDAEVYINGVLAVSAAGYTTNYSLFAVSAAAAAAVTTGTNTLAVHCHQTAGGQYIDVGFGYQPPS
jgi:hypothetical protein